MRGDGVFVRDGKLVQYGTHDGGGLGEVVHELRRRVQPPPYCHDPLCHRRCLHLPSTHSRSRATQSDIVCRSKEQQAQAAFHLDRRTREAQRLQLGSDHSGPTLLEPVACSHCCCTQGEQEEQCLAVSVDGRHSSADHLTAKTHRSPLCTPALVPSCVSHTNFSRGAQGEERLYVWSTWNPVGDDDMTEIPVVRLPALDANPDELRRACHTVGLFYLDLGSAQLERRALAARY